LDKFGTYTACANALKITNDNLANKMNRLSSKFLHQLKTIGVDVPPIDYGFTLEITNPYVKEHPQQYKDFKVEIEQLKKELAETKKIISISVNRITDLEMENEKLRVESAALLKTIAELGGGEIGNKL